MSLPSLIDLAYSGTVPHATNDSCPFCHRYGVPILPVRYAAHLPEALNPAVESQGHRVPSLPTPAGYPPLSAHHYTLRLLRHGYLYLYDETAERAAAWYITKETKYAAYPLAETNENGVPDLVRKSTRHDEPLPPFRCNNKANYAPATMIHWPVTGPTSLWLCYSPLPIPTPLLQRLVRDPAWRTTQMRPLRLDAPQGPHIFPARDIPTLLAEEHDNRRKAYIPHDYVPHPFLESCIGSALAAYAERKRAEVRPRQRPLEDNFYEHVDAAAFHQFKQQFEAASEARDQQTQALDQEYAEWLIAKSADLQARWRWMQQSPLHAILAMPLLLQGLVGNVISKHSQTLWHDHLLQADQNSLLFSTLGLQDPQLIEQLATMPKGDESGFLDQLLTTKNVAALGQAVNTYLAKVGMALIGETLHALLHHFPDQVSRALDRVPDWLATWKVRLTRYANLYRRLRGEPIVHIVKVTMTTSERYNFIRSLPITVGLMPEPQRLQNIATITDSEGATTHVQHQPYDRVALRDSDPMVTVSLLIEDDDLHEFKRTRHDGERTYTATIEATAETFSLSPAATRKLEWSFSKLIREEYRQLLHEGVGLLFAFATLYDVWKNGKATPDDMVTLVSAMLGLVTTGTGSVDTVRKGMVVNQELSKLRMFQEAPWCKTLGRANNILGLVGAGYELIHALQARHDGEPTRMVKWKLAGSGVTVAAAVLTFVFVGPGSALVIGVAGVVIGALFAQWASQALTDAQRIWINRSIFGRHPHYRGQRPFGGDTDAGALVYIDRTLKTLEIDTPFGGSLPVVRDEAALCAYHRQALKEEIESLAVLVRGITLSVDTYYTPSLVYQVPSAEQAQQRYLYARITLSVPEKVDGYISLELSTRWEITDIDTEQLKDPNKLRYKKTGPEIIKLQGQWDTTSPLDFKYTDGFFTLVLNNECEEVEYNLVFTLCTLEDEYNPAARERLVFNAKGSES